MVSIDFFKSAVANRTYNFGLGEVRNLASEGHIMGGKIGKSRQQHTITVWADPGAEVEVKTIDATHG